VALQVLLHLSV